jgi:flagellar basal-body rod protein FlgF
MELTTNVALARQIAIKDQMSVIANNIAHMSTGGYKGEKLVFKRVIAETFVGDAVSFPQNYSLHRDTRNGPITRTSNQLDIALRGEGYLTIQTPKGITYSRNGHLGLNNKSELVTSAGHRVLDRGNKPIVFDNSVNNITISKDGSISADGDEIGKLGVVRFENPQALKREGSSLFNTKDAPLPDDATEVLQGHVEGSNVRPVLEMTQFMNAARNFTTVSKMIEREDDRQRRAIEEVGRVM